MTVNDEKNSLQEGKNIFIYTQEIDKNLKSIKAKDFIQTLLEIINEDNTIYN